MLNVLHRLLFIRRTKRALFASVLALLGVFNVPFSHYAHAASSQPVVVVAEFDEGDSDAEPKSLKQGKPGKWGG